MANNEHLRIINQGAKTWNSWKEANREITPNLRGADLREAQLSGVDLVGADCNHADLMGADLSQAYLSEAEFGHANLNDANLSFARIDGTDLTEATLRGANLNQARIIEANLSKADLREADLREVNLSGANLSDANLTGADLSGAELVDANFSRAYLRKANLNRADLSGADLTETNFSGADLSETTLYDADLSGADLSGADLTLAHVARTAFGNNDLSTVKGLKNVMHLGPSTIGVDTLYKSDGKIPEVFLRGAGIPEDFITFLPSLVGRAIEFYSSFISYSHEDEEFSQRLHSRMRSENLRVWYAPEDMRGGKKLHEEIFRAIQIHDKLLLVLSENSMKSEWVMTEIRRARKVEREESRRKLFPIRLVDFDAIQKWECFDADRGKDLAVELREYYIPDFSNWKDHDAFEAEFGKLLRALRAEQH
jgi:uncharacterized protein YjbI with pentapeptide repeats